MTIYIGNLSQQATETDIRKLFGPYGTLQSVNIGYDAFTHRSRGFCNVVLEDRSAGANAILQLHRFVFMHKELIVREAAVTK